MRFENIKSIQPIGNKPTIDLEVNHEDHNFYVNGLVTSNSHSIGYACLSAQTLYLKTKYPQEFFLSLLKMAKNEPDPLGEISKIHKELEHFNIKLLPPNILKSGMDFIPEGPNIRFGLTSVKGISAKTIEKLNKFKTKHSNKFQIFKAAEEAGLSIGVVASLIYAGAMDDEKNNQDRIDLVAEAQLWNQLSDTEKAKALEVGADFEFNLKKVVLSLTKTLNEKGKPIIKESRLNTIKKHFKGYEEIRKQNKQSPKLCKWYYERKLIGYNWDTTLRDIYLSARPKLKTIKEAKSVSLDSEVLFIGWISEAKQDTSAKGTRYGRFLVSDEAESTTVLIFDNQRALNLQGCLELNGGLPKEDEIVIISGTKKEDAFFANTITVQKLNIYSKFAKSTKKKLDSKEQKP